MMLAMDKTTNDERVYSATRCSFINRWRNRLDRSFLLLARAGWHPPRKAFSFQYFGVRLAKMINRFDVDVVNIHWAANGFLRIEDLRFVTKPIVWTLHDMHPFTGGCHYSAGCRGFESDCRNCPILGPLLPILDASWVHRRKRKYYPRIAAVIAPSRWLTRCAEASSIFRGSSFHTIPNSVDIKTFSPGSKPQARRALGIDPEAKFVALFGASNADKDKRKGIHLLRDALEIFSTHSSSDGFQLLVFGNERPRLDIVSSFSITTLGHIQDDARLALAYQAADIFVLPSLEDNLPNTMLEAMACALPCVANSVGGMPDLIVDGVNGFLNRSNSAEGLAKEIVRAIGFGPRLLDLGLNARKTIMQECTATKQALAYSEVFRTCVQSQSTPNRED